MFHQLAQFCYLYYVISTSVDSSYRRIVCDSVKSNTHEKFNLIYFSRIVNATIHVIRYSDLYQPTYISNNDPSTSWRGILIPANVLETSSTSISQGDFQYVGWYTIGDNDPRYRWTHPDRGTPSLYVLSLIIKTPSVNADFISDYK